jgi:diadenosine tetraphosphate (Ap4A) HIT family hydrolase
VTDTFELNAQLATDTAFLADWPLCRVLLMNDARFPWLVLVPRLQGKVELFDVDGAALVRLMEEVTRAARLLKRVAQADKMNIAALGNVVPQLHVHVIARKRDDAAWPRPVWCVGAAVPYTDLNEAAARLSAAL